MPELIQHGIFQAGQRSVTNRFAIPEPGHCIRDSESLQAPLLDNFKPAVLGQIHQCVHVKVPTVHGAVEKLPVCISQELHENIVAIGGTDDK